MVDISSPLICGLGDMISTMTKPSLPNIPRNQCTMCFAIRLHFHSESICIIYGDFLLKYSRINYEIFDRKNIFTQLLIYLKIIQNIVLRKN